MLLGVKFTISIKNAYMKILQPNVTKLERLERINAIKRALKSRDVVITALIATVAVILYLKAIIPLPFPIVLLVWHMLFTLRLKAELKRMLQSAFVLMTVPLLLISSFQESFRTALLYTFLAAGILVHGSRLYHSRTRYAMVLLSLAIWIFPLLHPEMKWLEAVVAISTGVVLTIIVALGGD